jgi:hypothetical protein
LFPRPINRFTPATNVVNVTSNDISGINFVIDRLDILSIESRGTNGVELLFLGFPNQNYTIEASTNLVDWRFLYNTNAPATSNGVFRFTDSAATNIPMRFYRAVSF